MPGIVEEADRWLTAAMYGPTIGTDLTRRAGDATTAERPSQHTTPTVQQQPLFDLSPNASVVARDWRGSMKVIGSRTMLVDDLRPTASNRLVMARLATDARLTTFVQAGVGEWRIDTAMFPNARSYSEIAGQVGAGFELRLSSSIRLAGEAQYTMLYHDHLRFSPEEVAPHILACVLAASGRF
jgi:hypothetical protein